MFARRRFLTSVLFGAALATVSRAQGAVQDKRTIGLGFSLYGMKTLTLADALQACAEIGYD